jgi:hypothetical protein
MCSPRKSLLRRDINGASGSLYFGMQSGDEIQGNESTMFCAKLQ